MSLFPSNMIAAQITGDEVFLNLAGSEEADPQCKKELEAAGIKVVEMGEWWKNRKTTEVHTRYFGEVGPWGFERAWYYWIAKGPGIPPAVAKKLHDRHGKAVRVQGNCGCPDPIEYLQGFAVGMYHVDTQAGLKALADTIRGIVESNSPTNLSESGE